MKLGVLGCAIILSAGAGPASAITYKYTLTSEDTVCTGATDIDCTASLSFDVNQKDFGEVVRLDTEILFYSAGSYLGSSNVIWYPDIASEPGDEFCTDLCAEATTDASGDLTSLYWNYFNSDDNYGQGDLSGFDVEFTSYPSGRYYFTKGTWTDISNAPVPLPGTLPALLGALGLVAMVAGKRHAVRGR